MLSLTIEKVVNLRGKNAPAVTLLLLVFAVAKERRLENCFVEDTTKVICLSHISTHLFTHLSKLFFTASFEGHT